MKEFVLIFRNSNTQDEKPSPEQMQKVLSDWMQWMASLAAQEKLVDRGSRLSMSEGKTIHASQIVTDGPFAEVKEYINGFIKVKSDDIDAAIGLAKGCPILHIGGSVEVRAVVSPDDNS